MLAFVDRAQTTAEQIIVTLTTANATSSAPPSFPEDSVSLLILVLRACLRIQPLAVKSVAHSMATQVVLEADLARVVQRPASVAQVMITATLSAIQDSVPVTELAQEELLHPQVHHQRLRNLQRAILRYLSLVLASSS